MLGGYDITECICSLLTKVGHSTRRGDYNTLIDRDDYNIAILITRMEYRFKICNGKILNNKFWEETYSLALFNFTASLISKFITCTVP